MKKTIAVGERAVEIRRLKVREIKTLLVQCHDKIDKIFAIVDGNNMVSDGLGFVVDNFDWLVGFICQLTDLSLEEAEDLEAIELLDLTKALLKHNGLDLEKAKAFFMQSWDALNTAEEQTGVVGTMFEEAIPQLSTIKQEVTQISV